MTFQFCILTPFISISQNFCNFISIFRVTFRVRAVNSHFKGDFSEPKELEIGHAILQDAISQLEIVATADAFVTFGWKKLVAQDGSPLFGKSWYYRLSYR